MQDALVLHRPDAAARQLVLLFHGVGANAEDLAPLGEALAPWLPDALIASVRAPDASDFGSGRQWFSVRGVDEANRPARVAATMPRFVQTVLHWQQVAGVDAAATTLIGFSQGAIMALESTQLVAPPAQRVVAIAGRFAATPTRADPAVRVHLLHGDADPVMPVALSVAALARLQALGGTASLDRFPGLGHGIDARVLGTLLQRLPEPVFAAARVRPGAAARTTLLHVGPDRTLLLDGDGAAPSSALTLALGHERTAQAFFRQALPAPQEIERAIDTVEDEVMRARHLAGDGAELVATAAGLGDWAALLAPSAPLETVEQLFQRLASAALGNPAALHGLPAGREAAATLLILRELMHHLGHHEIVLLDAQAGSS